MSKFCHKLAKLCKQLVRHFLRNSILSMAKISYTQGNKKFVSIVGDKNRMKICRIIATGQRMYRLLEMTFLVHFLPQ